MRSSRSLLLVVLLSAIAVTTAGYAADWPAYRHDAARSGVTDEQVAAPLHLQWTYAPTHPPQPAWPEPGKEMHRMPFDYAYQVAAAEGGIYFGSSADDKVRALDAKTGQERWSFFTGGPVRFAPAVSEGRVFVASDDGWLYCLSAADGKLVWKFQAAPRDDMLIGNERMISRWPLRSGVLVEDGTVYVVAGMWPLEGINVYALRADDGSLIWKNDTSGSIYMKLPHPGSEGMAGVAPQGYLVAAGDILFVPTGRSVPAAFDRKTGRFMYYRASENKHNGGAWATAFRDWIVCGRHSGGPDIDVRLGEAPPAKSDGLAAWEGATGNRKLDLPGKLRMVFGGDAVYATGSGKLSAYDLDAFRRGTKPADCLKWETPCARTYALIMAGNTLFAGGVGKVTAFDGSSGNVVWTGAVNGEARGLAVADGRLLVSTTTGQIASFGARPVASPVTVSPNVVKSPYAADKRGAALAKLAERIVSDTGITDGYCLDLGAGDGRLAYELAKRTDLNIYCVEPDAKKVEAARRALDAAGLYGVRVTVHQAKLDRLPHASYFANLVVSETAGDLSKSAAKELYRSLRPAGGAAYLSSAAGLKGGADKRLAGRLAAAGVPEAETRISDGAVQIARGPLPGAGDWTHQYADAGKSGCASDQRVKWPLRLLWFGGPGPARMMSRHWRAAAPVSTNGRLFVAGEHSILAVDAYNGRELWSWDLPYIGIKGAQARGGNLAADSDTVYLATGGVCFAVDAATGEQKRLYRMPLRAARYSLDQPQTLTLGSQQNPLGTATVRKTQDGLELTLVTTDTKVTNHHRADQPQLGDSWELFFDFRPAEQRGGRYGRGAFQAIVVPATVEQAAASWKPGAGPAHPALDVSGRMSPTGSQTTVRLSWDEVRKLIGAAPDDFALGITLNSSDDGEKAARRTYEFASADSHRLTDGWATFALKPGGGAEAESGDLLPAELSESRIWGYLAWWDDLVLGSVGTATESQYVFALNKSDGRPRWTYDAEESVSHNAITIGAGRVFLIDRTSKGKLDQLKRRGEPAVMKTTLVALDALTGDVVWRTSEGIGGRSELWFADDVLLATSRGGMTAYSPKDGSVLWSRNAPSQRFPVIVNDTIYAQPMAYYLRTGESAERADPLTAEKTPWSFIRAYGCGYVSAAPNLLFFRSGTLGFYDLAGDSGVHNFGGIRPGCFVNMIAAQGLVLVPEGSSACTCSYNFQTSVALAPTTRNEDWGVFSEPTQAGRVRRLALNLGAPGDRRDDDGTMWLGFPRPSFHAAARVPLVTDIPAGPGYYRHNADELVVRGTARPWIYASGCRGLRRIILDLVIPGVAVSLPCAQAPKVDGALDDACWDGKAPLVLADSKQNRDATASAFVRSDDAALYIAFKRQVTRADGQPVQWTMKAKGKDAAVWNDDSWDVFLSDARRATYVQLGVSASGARFDGSCTYSKDKTLNVGWDGVWESAVSVEPNAWTLEVAIPWETLAGAGLNKDQLTINVRGTNRTGAGPATVQLTDPGYRGFGRCERFLTVSFGEPSEQKARPYTVRLHFAEVDDVKEGARVFDVKLQGKTVLKDFDIEREARGAKRAIVKEFKGVEGADTVRIDLLPKTDKGAAENAPIISGIELIAEES